MKITLKQWKTLEVALAQANQALTDAWHRFSELAIDHDRAGNKTEAEFLTSHFQKLCEMREAMPAAYLFHPQSEWLGGNSDDPENHKLKEPNIAPLPRRRFTDAEVAEAGLVCIGPCQWRQKEEKGGVKG